MSDKDIQTTSALPINGICVGCRRIVKQNKLSTARCKESSDSLVCTD